MCTLRERERKRDVYEKETYRRKRGIETKSGRKRDVLRTHKPSATKPTDRAYVCGERVGGKKRVGFTSAIKPTDPQKSRCICGIHPQKSADVCRRCLQVCGPVQVLKGEVGGWGRDPKKCTGRD